MTMEEMIKNHKNKPMPVIKVPEFLRYQFVGIKKRKFPFLFESDRHHDWRYWHSFSLGYNHLEVDTFTKTKGWYYRERTIYIPKIINTCIKFLFGKRFYSVSRTYYEDHTYHTEMVDYKTMKDYIKEFKEEGSTDIYISMKENRYSGWLLFTKDESKREKSFFNAMLSIWS